MVHALAGLIPDSNAFRVPRMNGGGFGAQVLEEIYNPDSGKFLGAFLDRDEHPEWARRIARYDRDDFHQNTPGTKKLFSEIASTLTSGEGVSSPNFRYALDLWDGTGDRPFTRYQQFGDCVDASSTEHEECLFGWRAAHPEFAEVFKYASTYGRYAERGYCGDGWDGPGIAAVALRTGAFLAMVYSSGGNTLDLTDEMKAESLMARSYCRSGLPQWLKDYVHANHPYEDGAITEYNGDAKSIRDVFASGGILQTGGTNTSGGSRPFQIGRVGGHEQSILGCDDSEEFRKFCQDKIGVAARAGDFPCVFSQTWGPGWSGETADQYWPVGTNERGEVVTQADINRMRGTVPDETIDAYVKSFAGTWGWGQKHEGAWVWWASDVIRYFGGDIMCWLPRVKGFPGTPVPPPPPPPGPTPTPVTLAEIEVVGTIGPGKYIVFPKVPI